MKITDPELLKTLREFTKQQLRRMNAEERAELEQRKGQSTVSSKHHKPGTANERSAKAKKPSK